jgi:hypothetical protein
MRRLLGAAVAAMLVAACGSAIAPPVSGGGFKLYEAASTRDSQLVAVVDTRSHSVDRTLPWGILAGTHLYSVTTDTLTDIDTRTGSISRKLRLPGAFELANGTVTGVPGGLSQSGRWLVMEGVKGQDTTASHLLIVDTSQMKVAWHVDLAGMFQFDAISNDGQRLFLIEYLTGATYRVRVYNVPAGLLDSNIVVDKTDPTETMSGIRVSGVASPDGRWLYSVYARPNKGAFIHALNLDGAYAFCLDLPGAGYESSSSAFQWSLALSADGTELFAANGAQGTVTEVHNNQNDLPTVIRSARVETPVASSSLFVEDVEAKELGTGGAVLSPDAKTLVMTGKKGLVWLDTATLRARSRQLTSWTVWSLALSPDGSTVYALNNAATIAELSMVNPGVSTMFGASGAQPMALIRVDSPQAP